MIRDEHWPVMQYVQSRGKLADLSAARVMGILNVTPDSFYDGGKYSERDTAIQHAGEMIRQGADIIDIGGMSTRPGAEEVNVAEELDRVLPVIHAVREAFPDILLSIDTVHGEVVRKASEAGVDWINDISAGRMDEQMLQAVADTGLPYILMHMQGSPDEMQKRPRYGDVVREVLDFFVERLQDLHTHGVQDIIIDPGFGFGKTVQHNFDVLTHLDVFRQLEHPILVGISRKSMINKVLKLPPEEALHGTGVLHFAALQGGARILRVHDVKEARQVITLYQKYADRMMRDESLSQKNNSKP